jgi:carboxyl-terminal processing protease
VEKVVRQLHIRARSLVTLLGITVVISSFITYLSVDPGGSFIGKTVTGLLNQVGFKEQQAVSSDTNNQNFNKISEVYQLVQDNYLGDVNNQKLIDGAIKGMLDSLEDPYTVYMDQESAKKFTESINSSFQGIGATVTLEGGKVSIESTIKGSPAEQAGLLPHDKIISVNGESIEGLDLYDAVLKIRGPKGTKAKLEVIRPGLNEPLSVIIIRDDIPIETVYSKTIEKNGLTLGEIEITQFSTNTAVHFVNELAKLEEQKMDGLVIDLRGNPGGLLNIVVEIAEKLIPDKGVILQVEDPNGRREVIKSGDNTKKDYPIVILIDKGSASASEILAGALKEHGYKLIGQPSFGKGTVQNTVELGDQSQVKMTIAKWLTPAGNWIHKKGIKPDIAIEQPAYFFSLPLVLEEGDALEFNQNKEQVRNLQVMLEGLGFPAGRKDGYFDEKTQTAVRAFQKVNGLAMTGSVDPQTAAVLQEQLIKKVKDPNNDLQLQAAIQVLLKQVKN